MSESIWQNGRPAEVTLTHDIYWAAQHPDVQRLRTLQNQECFDEAVRLADLGHKIDNAIMVWHWPADITMYARWIMGFTWVPAANQPALPLGPGISFPGLTPYDPNSPPPNSIRVSVDAADYPPFVKPVVVPPADTSAYVGRHLYGRTYTYGPASVAAGKYTVANGQTVSQDGKSFKAVFRNGLFGPSLEYEEV